MYDSKELALNPNWRNTHKVHDWRNYISEEVRNMWETFNEQQKIALMNQANQQAECEDWD